ncbi:hypothetical protein ACF07L_34900 [Streptomyces anulatus]|uniref:hypothetical protein n=1 Tax=Streptomyces anulatus TaxID=1892 RepID=UPI0036FD0129
MDPVTTADLTDGKLAVHETLIGFLTTQTAAAEPLPHRTISIAPTISFEGFTESDVFQQAADWTRKHVDPGDNAIVTTHFQVWTDRSAGEPRYELVLVLLAM